MKPSAMYNRGKAPKYGLLQLEIPVDGKNWTRNQKLYKGGEGLISTVEDYMKFAKMLLNKGTCPETGNQLISSNTLEFMTLNHLPNNSEVEDYRRYGAPRPRGIGWGLGFAVVLDEVKYGMSSSKGTFFWQGAASTIFWVDPCEKLTAVFATQLMFRDVLGLPLTASLHNIIYGGLATTIMSENYINTLLRPSRAEQNVVHELQQTMQRRPNEAPQRSKKGSGKKKAKKKRKKKRRGNLPDVPFSPFVIEQEKAREDPLVMDELVTESQRNSKHVSVVLNNSGVLSFLVSDAYLKGNVDLVKRLEKEKLMSTTHAQKIYEDVNLENEDTELSSSEKEEENSPPHNTKLFLGGSASQNKNLVVLQPRQPAKKISGNDRPTTMTSVHMSEMMGRSFEEPANKERESFFPKQRNTEFDNSIPYEDIDDTPDKPHIKLDGYLNPGRPAEHSVLRVPGGSKVKEQFTKVATMLRPNRKDREILAENLNAGEQVPLNKELVMDLKKHVFMLKLALLIVVMVLIILVVIFLIDPSCSCSADEEL
eukprot:augustus_masked-scaffold_5-processed-gene-17.14-mRNA-1 protein AED:1.00 eAED:1.00 QI:0/0/0/0/1/1/2/0/536